MSDSLQDAMENRMSERAWSPLTLPLYRSFWIAGLCSNLGTWMHETGAQWLMVSLDPSPTMVAAVRTAMTLPIFCLALPAGVWADRVDRRKYLLVSQSILLVIAVVMSVMTYQNLVTPTWLLLLTSAMGIGMIINQPAWQALTPELVPATMIPHAVAVGSVSFNLARSLGPAIGGLVIASIGVWATFLFNAFSFLGTIGVLWFWKQASILDRPNREPFMRELLSGLQVVATSESLRNVMVRVFLFSFPASILWSLLALVATEKLEFRERGFGICLGVIGAGAVSGVWFMPRLRSLLSSEQLSFAAQCLYAAICLLISLSTSQWLILPGLFSIGIAWMSIMTTLNATAQMNLPQAYRARGMSTYLMSFALGVGLGSITWGWLAGFQSVSVAFLIAAITMVVASLVSLRLKIGKIDIAR